MLLQSWEKSGVLHLVWASITWSPVQLDTPPPSQGPAEHLTTSYIDIEILILMLILRELTCSLVGRLWRGIPPPPDLPRRTGRRAATELSSGTFRNLQPREGSPHSQHTLYSAPSWYYWVEMWVRTWKDWLATAVRHEERTRAACLSQLRWHDWRHSLPRIRIMEHISHWWNIR